MFKKATYLTILLVNLVITASRAAENNTSDILNWVDDPKSSNLCSGYYLEPEIISDYPLPKPIKSLPTQITANHEASLAKYGASVLSGDVSISQPGRLVLANKVILYRDKKTDKITNIDLLGNIKLYEHGKLLAAEQGKIDIANKTCTLTDATYRLSSQTSLGSINSWGKAKKVLRDALGALHLHKTSFTTCPPKNVAWQIKSGNLTLDKNSGRGVATNTVLYARKIPVAYLPYINFPIDDRRKSGFLYPTISNSNDSGFSIGWPYYFNIAPNYDFLLTPNYYSKRGIYTDGLFRYLTKNSTGSLHAGYIPVDSAFSDFKDTAPNEYTKPDQVHGLSVLQNASESRGFATLANQSSFNKNWSSNLTLNYTSDDYFQRDYNNPEHAQTWDQLLNQGDLKYTNEHWTFLGRLQAFQTMHPLTYSDTEDQYMRLPQFNLNANYPNQNSWIAYGFDSQFVRFDHKKDFYTGAPYVTGDRSYIIPTINLPLKTASSYLTPKIELAASQYSLENQTAAQPSSLSQTIPLVSVDSGLFLQRAATLFSNEYTQTLEPRLYYLYVPIHNQDDFPNFDTTLPTFTFESLFRSNRFSGIDRIGDANQASLGLTTRLLDAYTGEETLNASIGQIYLFQKHHVCLSSDCTNDLDPMSVNKTTYFSPLVGKIQYMINRFWNTRGDLAYDPTTQEFNNAGLTLQYHKDDARVINLGYNFIKQGDNFNGETKNLNRVDFSFAWPVSPRWHFLADLNYNLSFIHPQTYFYGLEYESCCFAVRLIQSKMFKSLDANDNLHFENKVYLQFLFKGLGSVGTGGTKDLLTSNIANYNDKFSMRPSL